MDIEDPIKEKILAAESFCRDQEIRERSIWIRYQQHDRGLYVLSKAHTKDAMDVIKWASAVQGFPAWVRPLLQYLLSRLHYWIHLQHVLPKVDP